MGRLLGHESFKPPSDAQLDAATWCRHLVPDGSVYAFLADHRHELFPPGLFADLVVQGRSHPSVPTEVVATVMVLQAWRACRTARRSARCGVISPGRLPAGCGWMTRGSTPGAGVLASAPAGLDAAAADLRCRPPGGRADRVLHGRGRRVLDSTLLEDAVATQDTVTQLVAAIRRVRRLVQAPARWS